MKDYFAASTNIELILSCASENLSEDKIQKFKKRRKQCLKHIKAPDEEEMSRFPDYKPDKFKITFDEKVGRHGLAQEDIEFGDCVLVDEPIACRGNAGQDHHCDQCLSKLFEGEIICSPLDTAVSRLQYEKVFGIEKYIFRLNSVLLDA